MIAQAATICINALYGDRNTERVCDTRGTFKSPMENITFVSRAADCEFMVHTSLHALDRHHLN